jgi:putative SOS response-associated peptidase YedK
MCFTVNINIVKEELVSRYGGTLIDHENYRPSYYYHAFAFPELPVVTRQTNGENAVRLLNWGLIPSWIKTPEEAKKIRGLTHNARGETLGEKASFAEPYSRSRGLLPVKGFFEWRHEAGRKIPYYIYHPDQPVFSLAAIFDRWSSPENDTVVNTFSIVTTKANKMMSEIHNSKLRMPVIIDPDHEKEWLFAGTSRERLDSFLQPYPDTLASHTISPLIGNSKLNRNRPEIIMEYSYPRDQTLF